MDGAGETVLLYECLICGSAFGQSLNSKGEADRMVVSPVFSEACLERDNRAPHTVHVMTGQPSYSAGRFVLAAM